MSVGKKVPALRFKGFSGKWGEQFLTDIALVIDPHPSHRAPDAVDNGIPFIGIGDISESGLVDFKNVRIVSQHIYDEHSARYTIESGDFAYGRVASVGKVIDLSRNVDCRYTYSPTMAIVKPKSVCSAFLKSYLVTEVFKVHVDNKTSGSTRKSLGIQDFRGLPVLAPLPEEQAAIGNYFQKLDTLINQHQQKHDKLCQVKKAMLGKMFPKPSETIPEIRFKDFSGEWKEVELGDIFTYERPDNYIVKSTEYSDEYSTPVLTANKSFLLGYTDEKSTYNSPSIIFDDFTLDTKFVDFPYMVKSSAIKILTLKDSKKHDLLFAFNLLNITRIEVLGHARHYISVVQKTQVSVPKKEEQEAIGKYFQKLDALINQHQQQITKLNNIKQACLSKMFV